MAKATKTWFTVAARGNSAADIKIFNDIGNWGITAQDFWEALEAAGPVANINLSISSDGGDVSQGFAIYNMLQRHSAYKTVTVEGLAASMASVIAMTGDEVVMPANAMMMIHNPWGALRGEADQIKSFGEALEIMQDNIADAYVNRTGLDKAKVLDMMARETWLSAKKAKELGFADSVEDAIQIAAHYDVAKFHNVPKSFATKQKELTMTDKSKTKPKGEEGDSESETDGKGSVKTEAQIRQEALAYAREVRSICNLAGKPDLADGFIEKDTQLSAVITELDKLASAAPKTGKELKTQHGNAGVVEGDKPAVTLSASAIYDKWNKSGK